MNDPRHEHESRIARLLAASQAAPDEAPLQRARRRLAERDARSAAEPAWVRALARPAALAGACVLLVVSIGASAWLLRPAASAPGGAAASDLIAGLLGEDGSLGLVLSEPDATTGTADSGGAR